jgi:tetratricopeptide (TPR) repeat protein
MKKITYALLTFFILSQCTREKPASRPNSPLFDNLGAHQLTITTQSELAQKYFNQGLILAYGFNHLEAIRSFKEAVRQDSTCAMAYFGIAYCLGPNINAAMKEEDVEAAYTSASKAVKFSKNTTDWEKDVIEALSKRYTSQTVNDRSGLDKAYAASMKSVYEKYPDRADVGSWYAESLMDLYPWNYWTTDGNPQPWTPEILEVIESVLKDFPDHPGANHMYIHATEASQHPEKALVSAAKLGKLAPGAGHLVHMPSHTYIRTGNYHEGSLVNEAAAIADSTYIASCNVQGTYPLLLFPHVYHFLAATSAMEGRGKRSIEAAFQVANHTDQELMKKADQGTLQHYFAIPFYVLVKFAQWDYILDMKQPEKEIPYQQAVWHYARGMAFTGKNQISNAENELKKLTLYSKDTVFNAIKIWETNSVSQLIQIAEKILKAEILEKKGKLNQSIPLLREAVAIEGQLAYQEPPDWFFSVRQTLGTKLFKDGKYKEAESEFLEDLKIYRENGWALNGLHEALIKQGKKAEATKVKARFEIAWKWADVQLDLSEVRPVAYKFDERKFHPAAIYATVDGGASCSKIR